MGIKTMQWGNYASDYDGVIAGHIARILTGGNLSLPQWVPEEYLLKLEKQSFLDLLKLEKTHERIEALLKTGKPKRN
jgi:3-hydroxyacyl-CoA dehydrogenase